MLALEIVNMPTPALLKLTPEPVMAPVIELVLVFVIEIVLFVARVNAAAVRVAVLVVNAVNGAELPTAPVNVTPPPFVTFVVRFFAPFTVLLNVIPDETAL